MADAESEPLHRTIVLTDIEGSGSGDDVVRRVRRHHMHEAVQYALEAAGVRHTDQHLEDRGDGLMALISPLVGKPALLRALLAEVPARLGAYNRVAADSAQVRLRVVVAAGEVTPHRLPGVHGGAYGWDLDQAFRLLDGEPLKRALRERRGGAEHGDSADMVLCVSESVYQGVVRHNHRGIRGDSFHEVAVEGKEGLVRGWLHGRPAPGGTARGSVPPGTAAGQRLPEVMVLGDAQFGHRYGVTGGHVGGDVVMGDKIMRADGDGEGVDGW
ncbi:hypothetical protein [Streptomyces sp. NPDC049879]|uniref:hypothetical protein n=1 Tax=Streptomyces sp. NPDC049879 TaxID=3365598 RepID=UPI003789EE06